MSCISAKVLVFNEHISAKADIISENIHATAKTINEGIKATCSLICAVGVNNYLFVSPDYVWLTPEMLSGELDIMSNTDWIIN